MSVEILLRIRSGVLSLVLSLVTVVAPMATGQTFHAQPTPAAASAPTAIPALVPYSSLALNTEQQPLKGEVSMTFLIFKDEKGGEPLWMETQLALVDVTGRYKVELGAANAKGLPTDLFATGEARWLEVQIAGQAEQPRVLLSSVPYALKAADAATLGGLPASAFVLAGANASTNAALPAGVAPNAATAVTTVGGVSGYLAEYSGASTIVDSPVFVSGTSVGIGTTTPASTLDVKGGVSVRGALTMEPAATATTSAGGASQPLILESSSWNSSTAKATTPYFEWKGEASGNDTTAPNSTLHLLSASGTATSATETGFSFNANGTITFAPGQTFPSSGSGSGTITGVTAGTGLSGGGTTGNVTLSLNPAVVPELSVANTFTGTTDTFNGGVNMLGDTRVDFGGKNAGSITPAIRFGSGTNPGEAIASNRTGTLNKTGIDLYTNFLPRLSVTHAGTVGVNTQTPRSVLEAVVSAKQGLGPSLTLTNSGGGAYAQASIDFNTSPPSGSYFNPMSRIVAQDDGYSGNTLYFLSNTPGTTSDSSGFTSNNLQTNMSIQSSGQIVMGGDGDQYFSDAEVSVFGGYALNSDAIIAEGTSLGSSAIYGIGGGDSYNKGQSGGDGGVFEGGSADTSSDLGYGIAVSPGYDSSENAGTAGIFYGNVEILGNLSADVKNFKIDHPTDPANKYLVHASVESSEMMNIYSGNVTTDELGLATVKLPEWFEAANTDFRYQLTVLDERFAQAVISKRIVDHQFTIHTNASNVEVSWQVTAVRNDAYAKAHPLVVEEAKPERERGFYRHPELFGQPKEKQTEWGRNPKAMQRRQAQRAAVKARQAGAAMAVRASAGGVR